MKPALSMRQLMDRIDKYKRVKEDQTHGKGKAKTFPEMKDLRGGGYHSNWLRRDFPNQTLFAGAQVVSLLFKEPTYQILEKTKNEPYFKWPNKMGQDPSKRNQSLYCHYHLEKGHTTKDCRTLRDHLGQLVKAGKLRRFLHQSVG